MSGAGGWGGTIKILFDCFLGISVLDIRFGAAPTSPTENRFPEVENSKMGAQGGTLFD